MWKQSLYIKLMYLTLPTLLDIVNFFKSLEEKINVIEGVANTSFDYDNVQN